MTVTRFRMLLTGYCVLILVTVSTSGTPLADTPQSDQLATAKEPSRLTTNSPPLPTANSVGNTPPTPRLPPRPSSLAAKPRPPLLRCW